MTIEPIDLPSLLQSLIWPLLALAAALLFRRPLGDLLRILLGRIQRVSIAGISFELDKMSEAMPYSLDTEIRQPDANLVPQSGASGISGLLSQIQRSDPESYILIDLGSPANLRWLTSRLYILAYLLTPIERAMCFVFVESNGGFPKRFVGLATPQKARWALARKYPWLEQANAFAYANLGELPDPDSGYLSEAQVGRLIEQFLVSIRARAPGAGEAGEWVTLSNGQFEHAKWLDGPKVANLLGGDLSTSQVSAQGGKPESELLESILRQAGRFVAAVKPDKTFDGLIDRQSALESLKESYLAELRLKKT
jgi:hypothetical protein